MSDEKREVPRTDVLGNVPGEVSVLVPIAIRDLSRRGVMVESAFPLLLNSVHDVRLELGWQSVVARARVAHCRIGDLGQDAVVYTAGLEFVDLPDHVMTAIGEYLDGLDRRATAP
jgi:hypothetical protein